MEDAMLRRIEILSSSDETILQTQVNRFLDDLSGDQRTEAKLHFSASFWDSEGVVAFSVMIDYEEAP
jgi:hypothetical protein